MSSTRTRPASPGDPALRQHAKERREKAENRFADAVTTFAGSMKFVYVHVLWFASWVIIPVEEYPFGLLTMIVSLEAIFLSTFILISQNRTDEKRQVVADHQWELVQARDTQIMELLARSEAVLKTLRSIERELAERRPSSEEEQP